MVSGSFLQQGARWALLDQSGNPAVAYTSFMDIEVSNAGQVLSYPVENGGFSTYSKSGKPLSIAIKLGFQGQEAEFGTALAKLDEYKEKAVKLTVCTPSTLYENLTLESCSNNRTQTNNAGMIIVALNLVEVRELKDQSGFSAAITTPWNPTSASLVNTGRTQTLPLPDGLPF